MSRVQSIGHVFVEEIPERLDAWTLYISVRYATVLHLCMCGCGNEVVTPLAPTDWRFIFDGDSVSLDPSVGNWALPCRSHYWIDHDRVHWAGNFSDAEVDHVRALDERRKLEHYADRASVQLPMTGSRNGNRVLSRLKRWIQRNE